VGDEIDLVSSPCLEARLAPPLASGCGVVVDAGDVTFMDGSGVRVPRGAHELAARTDSVFSLRHPTRVVRRVLEIAAEITASTFLIEHESRYRDRRRLTNAGRQRLRRCHWYW
jgi:anti-anti-sigma factor